MKSFFVLLILILVSYSAYGQTSENQSDSNMDVINFKFNVQSEVVNEFLEILDFTFDNPHTISAEINKTIMMRGLEINNNSVMVNDESLHIEIGNNNLKLKILKENSNTINFYAKTNKYEWDFIIIGEQNDFQLSGKFVCLENCDKTNNITSKDIEKNVINEVIKEFNTNFKETIKIKQRNE